MPDTRAGLRRLAPSAFLACLLPCALPAQQDAAVETRPDLVLDRIAFGSCAKESQPQPIWSRVAAFEPQLWIWAGDNVYGDTDDMAVLRAKYAQLDAVEGYRAVVDQVPALLGTWDDHDYGRNDAGADYPFREQSQQVFLDFLGVPASSPRRTREGVYHAATFGPEGRRVQVLLLDTRYHRSALDTFRSSARRGGGYRPDRSRDKTMLGEAQWAWLEARLREPAELRLIVSSIQFVAAEHRYEKWANLPNERVRMLRLLERTGAEGVVFLSGDRHHAELSRLHRDGDYPLLDLTASGLNQSRAPRSDAPRRPPEPNEHRLGRVVRGHHFGTVEIDWDAPDPVVRLCIVMQDGSTPIEHTVRLGELRRGRPVGDAVDGRPRPGEAPVVVDGQPDEWDAPGPVTAIGRHVYAHFGTDEVRNLATGGETVRLSFAFVDDPGALTELLLPDAGWPEPELRIEFAPRIEGGDRRDPYRWRPRVSAVTAGGSLQELQDGLPGLHVQPGFASDRFELRLDRTVEALAAAGAASAPTVVFQLETVGPDGAVRQPLAVAAGVEPVAPDTGSDRAPTELPARPDDAVRIVSWNVLWATPQQSPGPYARILRALRPDILLLQEWDTTRYSEEELETWFREHVDAGASWSSMVTGTGDYGQGTAVVTPHPMPHEAPPILAVDSTTRWGFPVRFAAGVVETPAGGVLAGSVHLKAGGSYRSDEDVRRMDEARMVNAMMRGMAAVARPDTVVLGGDYNLNGSLEVVRLLGRNLDADRSGLMLAQPTVLGDPGLVHTFGRGPFKSRLDYVLHGEATSRVHRAFVLDTAVLDAASLEAMGLRAGDSRASDHLPVVVDLQIR